MPRTSMRSPIDPACPSELRVLIEQEGGFTAAAKKLDADEAGLRLVAKGKRSLTDKMKAKIEAAMRKNASPVEMKIGVNAQAPKPIEPWDGKKTVLKVTHTNTGATKTYKGVAEPLVKLIEAHGGNMSNAGRAMGYQGSGSIGGIIRGDVKYSPNIHAKVIAGLRGEKPPSKDSSEMSDEFDKYSLHGLTICLVNLNDYDRLQEIAEVLGGLVVFKKGTKAGWIVIYRFRAGREAQEKFKRLARRDANEIVSP